MIIEGEPEPEDTGDEDSSRASDVENIAIAPASPPASRGHEFPDEMWEALLEGRDAITDLPEGRWEEFLAEPRIAERVGKASIRGGYLSDIKGFDSEFFALSKMEADNIDPQQRMALELTWQALEHACIPASSLRGTNVAVYVGSSNNDYQFLALMDPSAAHPHAHHRYRHLDHRKPGVLLLRLPRTVGGGRHRLLQLAGRRAPGRARRCARARPMWPSSAGSTR